MIRLKHSSMFRKPLYSILFVILYLQTAIAGNWLTNNAASEVTFGEVATIVSRGGSGYCLVQKEGSIFWSNDGNTRTQGESYSGSNLVMRCAHFHDEKHGIVAGDKILEYTTNGGETWSEKSVGFNVRGVCMTSSNTAILVGEGGGKIARYTFGGSLVEQSSPTNNTLNSVSFYDGIGYACGDKGVNADAAGRDMGGDGKNGVKKDVYGYTLQYHEKDYLPIG